MGINQDENSLTGNIPSEVGNLSNMQVFQVSKFSFPLLLCIRFAPPTPLSADSDIFPQERVAMHTECLWLT